MEKSDHLNSRIASSRFPYGLTPMGPERIRIDIDLRFTYALLEKKELVQENVLLAVQKIEGTQGTGREILPKQIRTCREALPQIPGPPVFSNVGRDVSAFGDPKDGFALLFTQLTIPFEDFVSLTDDHRDYLAFVELLQVWTLWHFSDPTLDPLPANPLAVARAAEQCLAGRNWTEAVILANKAYQ